MMIRNCKFSKTCDYSDTYPLCGNINVASNSCALYEYEYNAKLQKLYDESIPLK